ncbi:pancreatic triacylglycerol lipase isoform X2 [Daphnia magna]|uniref:pancreatic triacylglycerol lipase isoform X2 n=1 Tax=Daphnia magna TaxID=35525 RepID=UPI001E1BA9B2|nr:pancreatic triacylglycerol lipase isoform X2 [Daphnia magna]
MGVLSLFVALSLAIAASSGAAVNERNPKASETVCYGDLGCFTTASPWTSDIRPISALPEDPAVINTRYFLNTRQNPVEPITLVKDDALGLYNSPFDSTKKTVFLVHGWTNDANHPWIRSSVAEILINEDVNIISVDWAPGAGLPYLRALTNTQVVGAEISLFILFLASKTVLDYANIHIIGHDLGAHVASYTGHRLYGIGRITGLDPSTIYFEGGDIATRLDPTDALLVDIVHTDSTYPSFGRNHVGLGFLTNLGHVDIYVNNGQAQPGCQDTLDNLVRNPEDLVTLTDLDGASSIDQYVCSHMRAVDYFVESINSFCPYSAFSCSSWDSYLKGTCYSTCRNINSCTSLGYHTGKYPARGTFHLDTQSTGPYCNLVLRVEVDVSPNQIETYGSIKYILIGDVGQTKEDELYNGIISNGFILSEYVTVAGSNAYRIGKVGSVRLRYSKDAFKENEIVVQRVVVQQANVTIDAVDNIFQGAVLPDNEYVTVFPV